MDSFLRLMGLSVCGGIGLAVIVLFSLVVSLVPGKKHYDDK